MKLIKSYLITFIFITLLILLCFWKIFYGFFQQDEWLSFAYRFLSDKSDILIIIKNAFTPSVGHFQPFNELTLQLLFSVFRLNYVGYAIVSIFLQIVNVFLIYIFAKKITSNIYLAFLISALFGISASSYQTTTWILADLGIHLSTIFIILCLINIFDFAYKKGTKYLYLSIIFLMISLLFKEIGLGLFGLLPIIILFFGKLDRKTKKRAIFYILIVGGFYLFLRFAMIYMPVAYSKTSSAFQSQPAKDMIYNLLFLPFLAFTQSIVPSDLLIVFLKKIAIFSKNYSIETLNSIPFNSFLEGQVLFIVCISVSLILILTGLVVYLKNKKTALAKNVFLGILLVLINTPIFALSPERSGIAYVLDSRNLYIPVLGSSIFVVVGLFLILKQNIRKTGLMLLPFLLVNMYLLFNKVSDISKVGMIRKSILQKVSEIMPVFPRKTIVYTESDKSFYALPEDEKIFPFQSGFGQTLLIWYFDKQKLPEEFLENRFLWELTSEDYKEFQGTGFGYFRNFENMADMLENYNLPLSSVISFRYDSKDNRLEDMSQEVRGRIGGYLVNKRIINRRSYNLFTSSNNKDVYLAKDGNRETFWDSKIPYAIPQYLEIYLETKTKIAQIQIDSYTNKNQGEIGYKILVKNSENQLETVYYSKSRTPRDGIVDIFFEPTLTNYVKIEQVGYHKFATWVIHEIKIYEAVN